MIKSWFIEAFKSARDSVDLEFAPITVFAGPNSSGKSTIIQSLLLTTQTLQSTVFERPIVLNGHIARLGSYTDLVSDSDERRAISIGFKLDFPPALRRFRSVGSFRVLRYAAPFPSPHARTAVDCRFSFSVLGGQDPIDILRLQPRLDTCNMRVAFTTDQEEESGGIAVRRSSSTVESRINSLHLDNETKLRPEAKSLQYEVEEIYPRRLGRIMEGLADAKFAGVFLRHFLPERITVVYDEVETEVRHVTNALLAPSYAAFRDLEEYEEEELELADVGPKVLEALNRLLEESEISERQSTRLRDRIKELESSFTTLNLRRVLQALSPSLQAGFAQLISDSRDEIASIVRGGRSPQYEIRTLRLPDILSAGVGSLNQFFAESVKYLGPLRDEPKPVYPLAAATDPSHVGYRGEFTAAVLDLYRHKPTEYIPTAAFSVESMTSEQQSTDLISATLDWLDYMGVGTKIDTVDRGRLGHELKVAVSSGERLHDITQVGVGVSQVLPILVTALISDPGSTLIFEQPELHLHPKVQSRLADFFVAMALTGRQCIIETHSDFLINRLRHRAATSEGKTVSDAIVMYFVQKVAGQSQYRKIRMNEFGVIEDWPAGFFDEAEQTAADTLRAGIAKRHQGDAPTDA